MFGAPSLGSEKYETRPAPTEISTSASTILLRAAAQSTIPVIRPVIVLQPVRSRLA
jgi:hypothetical protein